MTAWAGGDAAQRLIDRQIDTVDAALAACSRLFPSVDVRAQLLNAHAHD